MSGGRAIEALAKDGDPHSFPFNPPMYKYRDCTFSFAGLKHASLKYILREEAKYGNSNPKSHFFASLTQQYFKGIEADGVLPNVADLCASFQHAVCSHLCKRLQRAIQYIDMKRIIPEDRRILVIRITTKLSAEITTNRLIQVVSGGVACNQYLRNCLRIVCEETGYTLMCPPIELCTDNGIMIAWNGMEKWKAQIDVTYDIESIDIQAKYRLHDFSLPLPQLIFTKHNQVLVRGR